MEELNSHSYWCFAAPAALGPEAVYALIRLCRVSAVLAWMAKMFAHLEPGRRVAVQPWL